MSLDWNVAKVADYETLCWVEHPDGSRTVNPVTEALVFYTLNVGMGAITAKNAEEFYFRVHQAETMFGAVLNEWGPEDEQPRQVFISLDDVKAHIGLATNASNLTKSAFDKRLRERLRSEEAARLRAAERAAENEGGENGVPMRGGRREAQDTASVS